VLWDYFAAIMQERAISSVSAAACLDFERMISREGCGGNALPSLCATVNTPDAGSWRELNSESEGIHPGDESREGYLTRDIRLLTDLRELRIFNGS